MFMTDEKERAINWALAHGISYDTVGKYKDAETVIFDRMGWAHDGYYCDKHCVACPYVVADCEGNDACYSNQYWRCQSED